MVISFENAVKINFQVDKWIIFETIKIFYRNCHFLRKNTNSKDVYSREKNAEKLE